MGEPKRKFDYIQPDIRPNFDPTNSSKSNNGSSKALNKLESNPQKKESGSVSDQEKNGSSLLSGSWDNKVTGAAKAAMDLKKGNLKGTLKVLKGKGPITIIILVIVIAIFISVSSSSLLLIQLKETLTGFLDTSSPALTIRTYHVMKNKVSNSFNESTDGKCNIKCKFGTMSNRLKTKLEKQGFTIEGEKNSLGKWRVSSITFPDGTKTKTGSEFNTALKDTARASDFQKAFNSKTASFLSSKFSKVLAIFGVSKASTIKGDTEEEIKESTKKAVTVEEDTTNATTADDLKNNESTRELGEIIDEANTTNTTKANEDPGKVKGGTITGVAGMLCAGYDISRSITYATKTLKIAKFAAFAMVFLNAADQAKAGDGVDTIMSTLGDQVTATDSNGKTMTDSTGYQIAAYQSNVTLSSDYSAYGLGFSTILTGILTKLTSTLTEGGSTALGAARVTCKLADNIIVDIISSCPTVLNPATVPVAISLGIGGITADLFVCAVVATVSTAAISKAFSEALEKIVPALATSALPTLTSETIGEAGGDALYSGTASILGSKAAAYGLSAGNTEEIEQYAVNTASIKQQENKIASYDAKDDPFDATNSYSFLGSIIKTLNISSLYNNLSFLSAIKSLFSIIPNSFASLTSFAGAETLNISSVYSSDKCTDSSLTSIGVSADSLCNPSYVMSSDELNADINEVIDYMIENNQIDEDTGEAIAGSDYEKYLNNCANRTEPLGETSASITDGSITDNDYAWKIGLYCTDPDNEDIKEKLPYFHTYTMDKAIEDMTDEDFDTQSSGLTSEFDDMTMKQLAQSIIDSGNVVDNTGQIAQIAAGTYDEVNIKILKIIAELAQNNKFAISSLKRNSEVNGNSTSQHLIGEAVDFSGNYGINGVKLDYSNYNETVQAFIDEAINYLGDDCHQIGVPNNQYVEKTSSSSTCKIFIDTGTGPHIHIGINA